MINLLEVKALLYVFIESLHGANYAMESRHVLLRGLSLTSPLTNSCQLSLALHPLKKFIVKVINFLNQNKAIDTYNFLLLLASMLLSFFCTSSLPFQRCITSSFATHQQNSVPPYTTFMSAFPKCVFPSAFSCIFKTDINQSKCQPINQFAYLSCARWL